MLLRVTEGTENSRLPPAHSRISLNGVMVLSPCFSLLPSLAMSVAKNILNMYLSWCVPHDSTDDKQPY